MKPSEIVEGALEILEEKGWCQRAQINGFGQVCVGEALVQVATGDRGTASWRYRVSLMSDLDRGTLHVAMKAVIDTAYSYCSQVTTEPMPTIVNWNDNTQALTIERVRDTLTTTAKTLRNQGK